MEKQVFFVSRDVIFVEDTFTFSGSAQQSTIPTDEEEGPLWALIGISPYVEEEENRPHNTTSSPIGLNVSSSLAEDISLSPIASPIVDHSTESSPLLSPTSNSSSPASIPDNSLSPSLSENSHPLSPLPTPAASSHAPPDVPPPELLGRGQRRKTQSMTLRNYVSNMRFSDSHRCYLATIVENVEPKSFKLAFSNIRWTHVMRVEVDALEENETWTLEEVPPGKRAIGSK